MTDTEQHTTGGIERLALSLFTHATGYTEWIADDPTYRENYTADAREIAAAYPHLLSGHERGICGDCCTAIADRTPTPDDDPPAPTPVRWNGEEGAVINYETDPWLQDADGQPIDLADLATSGRFPAQRTDCEGCDYSMLPGVRAPANTNDGIERCDECQRFESDLDAARALAALIDPEISVWFEPHPASTVQ